MSGWIVRIEPCGCLTACIHDGVASEDWLREFAVDAAASGAFIRSATVDEIRANLKKCVCEDEA